MNEAIGFDEESVVGGNEAVNLCVFSRKIECVNVCEYYGLQGLSPLLLLPLFSWKILLLLLTQLHASRHLAHLLPFPFGGPNTATLMDVRGGTNTAQTSAAPLFNIVMLLAAAINGEELSFE